MLLAVVKTTGNLTGADAYDRAQTWADDHRAATRTDEGGSISSHCVTV
jgi:hypothetical protein